MPKKIDPVVRERAVRLVREHRAEYSSLTAAAEAVGRRERLGKETVRRWALQAEIDAGERPGLTSAENAEIKALKAKVAAGVSDVLATTPTLVLRDDLSS